MVLFLFPRLVLTYRHRRDNWLYFAVLSRGQGGRSFVQPKAQLRTARLRRTAASSLEKGGAYCRQFNCIPVGLAGGVVLLARPRRQRLGLHPGTTEVLSKMRLGRNGVLVIPLLPPIPACQAWHRQGPTARASHSIQSEKQCPIVGVDAGPIQGRSARMNKTTTSI
jgi:hypothetical protein